MQEYFRNYRPLLMGSKWMVTADHPLAVQAAAALLDKGAGERNAAEFAETIDSSGGYLSAYAELETITISGQFLSQRHHQHCHLVDPNDLDNRFNAWVQNHLLIGIEEMEESLAFELAVYLTECKTGIEWQPE